jgi:ribonuclease Y
MLQIILTVAPAIALLAVLVVLWGWVRPLYRQAMKAQENAVVTETRIQNELEIQRNGILLEAKENALRIREQAEAEAREKLNGLNRTEDRLCAKDEALEVRRTQIEEREMAMAGELRLLAEKENSIDTRLKAIETEIQHISELNKDQARELYLKQIEAEFSEIGLRRAKEVETQAVMEAEKRAKKIVLDVIQRSIVDYVTEATLAVVELAERGHEGADHRARGAETFGRSSR